MGRSAAARAQQLREPEPHIALNVVREPHKCRLFLDKRAALDELMCEPHAKHRGIEAPVAVGR